MNQSNQFRKQSKNVFENKNKLANYGPDSRCYLKTQNIHIFLLYSIEENINNLNKIIFMNLWLYPQSILKPIIREPTMTCSRRLSMIASRSTKKFYKVIQILQIFFKFLQRASVDEALACLCLFTINLYYFVSWTYTFITRFFFPVQ